MWFDGRQKVRAAKSRLTALRSINARSGVTNAGH
jgi:hypothetical protein